MEGIHNKQRKGYMPFCSILDQEMYSTLINVLNKEMCQVQTGLMMWAVSGGHLY